MLQKQLFLADEKKVEGETIIKLRKISTKYFGQKWQRRTEDDPEAAV